MELSLQECKKLSQFIQEDRSQGKEEEFSAFCLEMHFVSKAYYGFWKLLIKI